MAFHLPLALVPLPQACALTGSLIWTQPAVWSQSQQSQVQLGLVCSHTHSCEKKNWGLKWFAGHSCGKYKWLLVQRAKLNMLNLTIQKQPSFGVCVFPSILMVCICTIDVGWAGIFACCANIDTPSFPGYTYVSSGTKEVEQPGCELTPIWDPGRYNVRI